MPESNIRNILFLGKSFTWYAKPSSLSFSPSQHFRSLCERAFTSKKRNYLRLCFKWELECDAIKHLAIACEKAKWNRELRHEWWWGKQNEWGGSVLQYFVGFILFYILLLALTRFLCVLFIWMENPADKRVKGKHVNFTVWNIIKLTLRCYLSLPYHRHFTSLLPHFSSIINGEAKEK